VLAGSLPAEPRILPITFEVDHAAQRVMAKAIGDVRLDDFAAMMTTLGDLSAFAYAQRIDARGSVLLLTADDVRRMVRLVARLREQHGHARTAFITDSDVSFGMARMYATLSAETDGGYMVYRSIDEGDAWLSWPSAATEQRAT
jgi:hypothetical protein